MARAYLQFKSFSLAAHNQITLPMVERARVGDMQAVYTLGFMATSGLVVELVKLAEAKRLDELKDYKIQDIALAMADRSGAVPLLMMAFNDLDVASGNLLTEDLMGAMPAARASDRTRMSMGGPTAGTIGDVLRMGAALTGQGGPEARDFRAVKRLLPFNNLAGVNRLAREAEDYLNRGQSPRRRKRGGSAEAPQTEGF